MIEKVSFFRYVGRFFFCPKNTHGQIYEEVSSDRGVVEFFRPGVNGSERAVKAKKLFGWFLCVGGKVEQIVPKFHHFYKIEENFLLAPFLEQNCQIHP